MIAGQTFLGIGASAQLSFSFAISELVVTKHIILANEYCYLWLILPNAFGSPIGYAFAYESNVGWRGTFYLLITMNLICTALWSVIRFEDCI
jgi:predicted MFS family arabinose efflux permease